MASLERLEYYRDRFNKQIGQRYPCGNQIVVCGIITKSEDKAERFMKNKDVVSEKNSWFGREWLLNNGERWVWRRHISQNCRGYRYYKIAVDVEIDDELLDLVVLPYCNLYCCSFEII